MSNKSPQDIYYYRPLHIWAKCAGILPNFNLNHLQPTTTCPNWHCIMMTIVFSCIYAYSTYGKITYMRHAFHPSIFVTDIGGDMALYVTNLTSIVRISLIKAKEIRSFLYHMKKIDAELRTISFTNANNKCKNKNNNQYPHKVFIVEFVLTNILFVIYYIYDAYIWVDSVTWNIYKYFFLRDMQCFHVIILSLVVRNYSLAIRNRMRILNKLLMQMRPHNGKDDGKHMNLIHVLNALQTKRNIVFEHIKIVRKMRQIYAQICVSISIFNDIFGWIYLLLYVVIVAYLLTSCNIALVYGIGNKQIGKADFGIALLILCVLWAALPLIIGFFIFSSADKVFFEIKRTPIICYSIMDSWLPIDEDHMLLTELEKFAQQVANSQAEITAAGFFAVDYAIFFALIGSLSSYLIVLIQFM